VVVQDGLDLVEGDVPRCAGHRGSEGATGCCGRRETMRPGAA